MFDLKIIYLKKYYGSNETIKLVVGNDITYHCKINILFSNTNEKLYFLLYDVFLFVVHDGLILLNYKFYRFRRTFFAIGR